MILHCVQNLCLDINFEDNDDISAMHKINMQKVISVPIKHTLDMHVAFVFAQFTRNDLITYNMTQRIPG